MTEEERIERCARAAHNTLAAYCKANRDHSLKEWDDAEEWQRRSSIDMVRSVLDGAYSPRAEHERWLKDKLAAGYVHGEVKNDDRSKGPLTNPSVMDYDLLPLYLRMKNLLGIVVIVGTAASYDLVVRKVPDLTFA
jgi:hypothetical protein